MLTTFTIFKEAVEVLTKNHEAAGVTGLLLGAIAFVVSIVIGMLNRPERHHEHSDAEHFTMHGMLDHMIEQANTSR